MSGNEITHTRWHDKNKCEFKQQIETCIRDEIFYEDGLKNKVKELEEENLSLKKEIEHINKENKKNAIIILCLNQPQEKLTTEIICWDINKLLEVGLEPNDYNVFYRLGKKKNNPLKIIFTTF